MRQLRVTTDLCTASTTLDSRCSLSGQVQQRGCIISTFILVLLLTFGAASALDRFVQSHWVHEVLCAMQTSQDYAGCFAKLFGDH